MHLQPPCVRTAIRTSPKYMEGSAELGVRTGIFLGILLLTLPSNTLASRRDMHLHLVGGIHEFEGRLDVFYNGSWGTVCDRDWDLNDASVVCRMMGYGEATSAAVACPDEEGGRSSNVLFENVICEGNEASLLDCNFVVSEHQSCDLGGKVCMRCTPVEVEKELRLVGGSLVGQGRLEIFHSNQWGTVCDRHFTTNDASVACRQLGFPGFLQFYSSAEFGEGEGAIWVTSPNCTGMEIKLADCSGIQFGLTQSCQHTNDVSVLCGEVNGSVRLVNGSTEHEGRVEVYHAGKWGTVCNDNFGFAAATVVCRQLGYLRAVKVAHYSEVTPGTGIIWLDEVQCNGGEASLDKCSHSSWGRNDCHHSEDVGVVCSDDIISKVRLVSGSTGHDGRVEILRFGQWGTICDDHWDITDARVVCKELGFMGAIEATNGSYYGNGTGPIWLSEVNCEGTEKAIDDCQHPPFGKHNCDHSKDVGVICDATSAIPVRLMDGRTAMDGRVEVYHNNEWGSVCFFGFDDRDGIVICRQLGYHYLKRHIFDAPPPQTDTPFWISRLACTGLESEVTECDFPGLGLSTGFCSHYYRSATAVTCLDIPENHTSQAEGTVRLIGGAGPHEGRVEVFYLNQWGTVCDSGWSIIDALVVCRQLGYTTAVDAPVRAAFGPGRGPIWLGGVACSGSEANISQCDHVGLAATFCKHDKDAGAVCANFGDNEFDVRLVGSNHEWSGRLEIFRFGSWGTVCRRGFTTEAARVVCRQLGMANPAGARLLNTYAQYYGAGDAKTLLDGVYCRGNENSLDHCTRGQFGEQSCMHDADVFMTCFGDNVTNIRLTNGTRDGQGRVEVEYAGLWGTICNNSFDINDANVICRSMGYPGAESTHSMAPFSGGEGVIWLDNLSCHGNESTLDECPGIVWGAQNCFQSESAAVTCTAMPLQCPLVQVSNGDVAEEVNTDNDQVQVLTCHPGYQPVGGVTRLVCNHTTGTWIAMEFINNGAEYTFGCEAKRCPAPPVVADIRAVPFRPQPGQFVHNTTLLYHCIEGYAPADTAFKIRCVLGGPNGTVLHWEGMEQLSTCSRVTVEGKSGASGVLVLALEVVLPFIAIIIFLALILIMIVLCMMCCRHPKTHTVQDTLPIVPDCEANSVKMKDFVEFSNPCFVDADEDAASIM